MGIYFNGVVHGVAQVDLVAPYQVIYVAADVTVQGPGVRQLGQDDPDHLSRVGWFALGDRFDIGEGVFDRWRDPIWVNWEHFMWTPDPSTDAAGNAMRLIGVRLRYWFSPGTYVRLQVYGA